MANITLKTSLGDAGAGMDASLGDDRLIDVVVALQGQNAELIASHQALVTSFNAVLAKLDAESLSASDYVSSCASRWFTPTDTITVD